MVTLALGTAFIVFLLKDVITIAAALFLVYIIIQWLKSL